MACIFKRHIIFYPLSHCRNILSVDLQIVFHSAKTKSEEWQHREASKVGVWVGRGGKRAPQTEKTGDKEGRGSQDSSESVHTAEAIF